MKMLVYLVCIRDMGRDFRMSDGKTVGKILVFYNGIVGIKTGTFIWELKCSAEGLNLNALLYMITMLHFVEIKIGEKHTLQHKAIE